MPVGFLSEFKWDKLLQWRHMIVSIFAKANKNRPRINTILAKKPADYCLVKALTVPIIRMAVRLTHIAAYAAFIVK